MKKLFGAVVLAALGGAALFSDDIKRYLRMRSM